MKTPLVEIYITSVYTKNGVRVPMPKRMAYCTPDMYNSILAAKSALEQKQGNLYLSDLFRSYDMQLQAHIDWKSGKKSAYSPPPGGSMHEAGRAFDLDLNAIKIQLSHFWTIASNSGLNPIIEKPDSSASEAWHFDCRGSHAIVYEYYKSGLGNNMKSPYRAMAISGILAIGIKVDVFEDKQDEAAIQAGLIRLGQNIGNIDGNIGNKTLKALDALGIERADSPTMLEAVEKLLQHQFPNEYSITQQLDVERDDDFQLPSHVVG